jgi:hypothetical protein
MKYLKKFNENLTEDDYKKNPSLYLAKKWADHYNSIDLDSTDGAGVGEKVNLGNKLSLQASHAGVITPVEYQEIQNKSLELKLRRMGRSKSGIQVSHILSQITKEQRLSAYKDYFELVDKLVDKLETLKF